MDMREFIARQIDYRPRAAIKDHWIVRIYHDFITGKLDPEAPYDTAKSILTTHWNFLCKELARRVGDDDHWFLDDNDNLEYSEAGQQVVIRHILP